MRENTWPLSFCTWLTSLNMISPLASIYLQMTKFHSSLWLNNIPHCMCIYTYILYKIYVYFIYVPWCIWWYTHNFLIHSSVAGHLDVFHFQDKDKSIKETLYFCRKKVYFVFWTHEINILLMFFKSLPQIFHFYKQGDIFHADHKTYICFLRSGNIKA
jgi:hypothetical protein